MRSARKPFQEVISSSLDRRTLLRLGTGALGATALSYISCVQEALGANLLFRYAICNELFEKRDFAEVCRSIKAAGFEGIEIAPFTLGESVEDISTARRREMRRIIQSEGLTFVGLHWLLITPKWLHVTTADQQIREKSWGYLSKLVDFCADLGENGVMIFGSPKQRCSKGNTKNEAAKIFRDGLASLAPHAGKRGVTILIESLPRRDTDVVNTLSDAVCMVDDIRHPAIQTMFDFHNTADEKEPLDILVRKNFSCIQHVHINEMDGRYPGTGNFDFLPVLKVLTELKYKRWISLGHREFLWNSSLLTYQLSL